MAKITKERKSYLQSLSESDRNFIARFGGKRFSQLNELERQEKENAEKQQLEKHELAIQESFGEKKVSVSFSEVEKAKDELKSLEEKHRLQKMTLIKLQKQIEKTISDYEKDMEEMRYQFKNLEDSIVHDLEFIKLKAVLIKAWKRKKAKESRTKP